MDSEYVYLLCVFIQICLYLEKNEGKFFSLKKMRRGSLQNIRKGIGQTKSKKIHKRLHDTNKFF